MTDVKVGVFNVLAAGMSACSDIFDDLIDADEKAIFKLFQDLSFISYDKDLPEYHDTPKWMEIYAANNIEEGDNSKTLTEDYKKKIVEMLKAGHGVNEVAVTKLRNLYNIEFNHTIQAKLNNLLKLLQIDRTGESKVIKKLTFDDFVTKCFINKDDDTNTIAGFLKDFSSNFPYTVGTKKGQGMGLYGGFKLGIPDADADADAEIDIGICKTEAFKTEFYSKKKEFIQKTITAFFKENPTKPSILICPEYDYHNGTGGDDITIESTIKQIPCGNFINSTVTGAFDRTQFDKGKPKMNPKTSNFFRKVFYTGNELELLDTTTFPALKELNKNKKKVDVFFSVNNKIIFIGVHLDSTTAMSQWKEKKRPEIINLLQLIYEIKTIQTPALPIPPNVSEYEIIIAGDFNFPYFKDETFEKEFNEYVQDGYCVDGFDGFEYGSKKGKVANGFVDKNKITLWKQFQKIFGLTSNGNVGVCLKERFTETLGNDKYGRLKETNGLIILILLENYYQMK